MKFLLTLYVCSVMHNNCMPVSQEIHPYQIIHDTFDSCIKDGLGQSFEVFFNGNVIDINQINESKLYPKFVCEPFVPQDVPESTEQTEST